MCGLCGTFGAADHWTDGLGEGAALSPSAERRRRAAVANEVLALYGLKLTEWANRYTLTGRTGKSAVVEQFGAVWAEAERLTGRTCDPLDPAVIEAMEARQYAGRRG
ncbi:hypothetical protein IGS68_30540 (plasmid) [Skermanella sp. TT6]|uniref:Uncharacterized protein n=1 Tax=Skermanella cutis TaxID=2775420 RepID=A0ABX7BEG6_9PROT|nr:hypothetical protein [Skermanella sp. TT6]QQP92789.1 hypothetical protein IGS68_30540 [Skermanella sp. TT6]